MGSRQRGLEDTRTGARDAQTRSWAAPLPDFSRLPRANEPVRARVEWETRDSMNQRLWAAMQDRGGTVVSASTLLTHPTAGAHTMMPAAARQDQRTWVEQSYYPDGRRGERPLLPARHAFQNPWLDSIDVEGGDVTRELRGVVKEDNRFRDEDLSARIAGRTFTHQWLPPAVTAEFLRAQSDDYTKSYR